MTGEGMVPLPECTPPPRRHAREGGNPVHAASAICPRQNEHPTTTARGCEVNRVVRLRGHDANRGATPVSGLMPAIRSRIAVREARRAQIRRAEAAAPEALAPN